MNQDIFEWYGSESGWTSLRSLPTQEKEQGRTAIVKQWHNSAALLPPWLHPTLSLCDRLTHRWTPFAIEKDFLRWTCVGLQKKKANLEW